MKVILHGATDFGSSNFGDFLYGEILYTYLKSILPNADIKFYNPSAYFRKYISGYEVEKASNTAWDILIYIPGGYFGEGHKARFRDCIFQFIRFMPVGIRAVIEKKKILVIGVGAGPNRNFVLSCAIRMIGKHSEFITVRDHESYTAMTALGIKDVHEGLDPLMVYDLKKRIQNTDQVEQVKELSKGKPILFIHYNHSKLALSKFAETIKLHKEIFENYFLVVGADQILNNEIEMYQNFIDISGVDCFHFFYESPYELIGLINLISNVITCKLHVGVVSAMFGKSVICVAEHPEKTERFYKSINASGRCISLYDASSDLIMDMFNNYKDIRLTIPNYAIENAKVHYEILKEWFLDNE